MRALRSLAFVVLTACPPAGDGDAAVDTDSDVAPVDSDPPAVTCTEGDACDGRCVDVLTDPRNCGGCGRTCVVPHAEAACVEGACAIATCELGWVECDEALATGCEAPDTCEVDAPCTTTCGTTGAVSCADACAPACAPPVEACNARDDDCDGACDEGPVAGCRVAVHRAFSATRGHLYTASLREATAWGLEAQDYFWLYEHEAADLRPFQRCAKANGSYFFNESNDCEGTGAPLLTAGFFAPVPAEAVPATCGSVPLYRIFNPASGWHFYTVSIAERDAALGNGWVDQGVAGNVWTGP